MGKPTMHRLLDSIVTASGIAVGFAAFLIGVSVSYDVLARTVFGAATTWVTDINTYIMGFITFVGAGYALREDAHVSVNIVVRRLGERSQRYLGLIADAIVLVTVAVVFWLACEFWWSAWRSGERSWGLFTVQLWIPYLSMPVGLGLLFAVQIRLTAARLRRGHAAE